MNDICAGVRGFGLAQLAHGLTYLLTVARGTLHESLLPAPADREEGAPRAYTHSIVSLLGLEGDLFDAEQLALATALTGSSLLKHLLTEADRITLSLTASAHEQVNHPISKLTRELARINILFVCTAVFPVRLSLVLRTSIGRVCGREQLRIASGSPSPAAARGGLSAGLLSSAGSGS